MYDELIFTEDAPKEHDAYAGGGVYLPKLADWPVSPELDPLLHLFSIPSVWTRQGVKDDIWISVFIPYTLNEVTHFAKLRCIDGKSQAKVVAYQRAACAVNKFAALRDIKPCAIRLERSEDEDDGENFASKLYGEQAWLQRPIFLEGFDYVAAINGIDMNIPFHDEDVLSDGMGYLFMKKGWESLSCGEEIGRFFLQLG